MNYGQLNFYRDLFLELEELNKFQTFMKNNPALFLFMSNIKKWGVVQYDSNPDLDINFVVEPGTIVGTVKISGDVTKGGSFALDVDGNMINLPPTDNIAITNSSGDSIEDTWAWVKISHETRKYETGVCSINEDGVLSGSGTSFTDLLRGQSSGFPVAITLFKLNNKLELVSSLNTGIYEVSSVDNDSQITLHGSSFTPDTNLVYVINGAFSLGASSSAIASEGIYNYSGCKIEFVDTGKAYEEINDVSLEDISYDPDREFIIGLVLLNTTSGAAIPLTDGRSDHLLRIDFNETILNNYANSDASNLMPDNILSWLAKLNIYTKTEVNNITNLLAKKDGTNLTSVSGWLTALSVYSKSEINTSYPVTNPTGGTKMLFSGAVKADGTTLGTYKNVGALIITIAKTGTGIYDITHNIGNNNYYVVLTGGGYFQTTDSTITPKSYTKDSGGNKFTVTCANNDSADDGNFEFQIWSII